MLFKVPFILTTGLLAFVALLDHILRYTTAVLEPPCRSQWLSETTLCTVLGLDTQNPPIHISSLESTVAVNLAIDRAVLSAKSWLPSDSNAVISLNRTADGFAVLGRQKQYLRALADSVGQRVAIADGHVRGILRKCWLTRTFRWLCPTSLCTYCDQEVLHAASFFSATVTTAVSGLLPYIVDIHSTHADLLVDLEHVQDALAELQRMGMESEQTVWGRLSRTFSVRAELTRSLEVSRQEGLGYLFHSLEHFQYIESKVAEISSLLLFVESSPRDLMVDENFASISRHVEDIIVHIVTSSAPRRTSS